MGSGEVLSVSVSGQALRFASDEQLSTAVSRHLWLLALEEVVPQGSSSLSFRRATAIVIQELIVVLVSSARLFFIYGF